MSDALTSLVERVRGAAAERTPLQIRAGGTKDFYGNTPRGNLLDPRVLHGIVAYEPEELVITARAGTLLADVEATLHAQGQMLAFEPPHFGSSATIGGCVAAGLAGPRRASAGYTYGGVRDFLLGATLLDGRGQLLTFGGTVIKNVAGYDVARVLAGSLGILGLIVEVSLKVLPRPVCETTLRFQMDEPTALARLNAWCGEPLPISASAWSDGLLALRLSGARAAVRSAATRLGGETLDPVDAETFWRDIREHTAQFFSGSAPLWRLSLPATAEPLGPDARQLIEWGGALRWLRAVESTREILGLAQRMGGHATLFRGGDRSHGVFTPLAPPLAAIHQRLKLQFDPHGIFNPGRLFEAF
ncbi:MAG TPA: glycolate oxidase subunit GlcE [Steroidobacteraceae bacterium]|jgi:glycolate oxidase FAD binding subunit